ncbi:TPA: hypothetical protein ACH3X1_012055 [Trebouxia sp. C0004]
MASDLASHALSIGMAIPAADATLPAVPDKDTSCHGPTNGGTQRQSPVWKPIVMQAKHQTPCSYCHLPISPGNAIYPWGDYTGYMHLSCALKEADGQGVELLPPVCKHWSRRGYCLYKEKCFYRHPPDALPQKAIFDASNHNATTNQAQRISNRGVGRRNLVRNAFRAGVFRRFLMDTFGQEQLRKGSGVLDIAGGKGELSFELLNLNGIQATVVEPRALQLWRQHKWMLKGYYHRNINFLAYVDHAHGQFVSGERVCVDPPHLRMVFDEAVINSLLTASPDQGLQSPSAGQAIHKHTGHAAGLSAEGSHLQSGPDSRHDMKAVVGGGAQQISDRLPDHQAVHSHHASLDSHNPAQLVEKDEEWRAVLQQSMQLAKDSRWTHKGLQHEDGQAWAEAETGEPLSEAQQHELPEATARCTISESAVAESSEADDTAGGTDITDMDLARRIIQECSVIVGIHPDQAAEPIINFAQRTSRPFAMVPCCVYPMEFPRRRLPDGTHVRKYEQLIQYLQSRDPEHIQVATLPFEGRNQVVYCTGWSGN